MQIAPPARILLHYIGNASFFKNIKKFYIDILSPIVIYDSTDAVSFLETSIRNMNMNT